MSRRHPDLIHFSPGASSLLSYSFPGLLGSECILKVELLGILKPWDPLTDSGVCVVRATFTFKGRVISSKSWDGRLQDLGLLPLPSRLCLNHYQARRCGKCCPGLLGAQRLIPIPLPPPPPRGTWRARQVSRASSLDLKKGEELQMTGCLLGAQRGDYSPGGKQGRVC